METIIQFVQTNNNDTAQQIVEDKLARLYERYDWLIKAHVFFKEQKATNGKGKICEIRLSCPGPRIFASSNESTFEAAAAETINDLRVLLEKRKSEMSTA